MNINKKTADPKDNNNSHKSESAFIKRIFSRNDSSKNDQTITEDHNRSDNSLEKVGWHSPKYSMSRQVKLNPDTLHENRCIVFEKNNTTVDSYKILRTKVISRMQETGNKLLMVTSALPGEGKSTTAINLALIMAKEFQQTVLLVDCDLQQQSIHKYLGYESEKGLVSYLLDDCPMTDLFTWPGIEKINIISGGRVIRDSSELLGSPRMIDLVADMKNRYPNRYVIFDMQAVLAGADALVMAPLVDDILIVVQEGRATVKDIKRSINMLPENKMLGMVLNRHKSADCIATKRKK